MITQPTFFQDTGIKKEYFSNVLPLPPNDKKKYVP